MFPVPGSMFVFKVPVLGWMFMVLSSIFAPVCANQIRQLEPRTPEPSTSSSNSEHDRVTRNVERGTA
jgi:hypothetical protein